MEKYIGQRQRTCIRGYGGYGCRCNRRGSGDVVGRTVREECSYIPLYYRERVLSEIRGSKRSVNSSHNTGHVSGDGSLEKSMGKRIDMWSRGSAKGSIAIDSARSHQSIPLVAV